MKLPLSKQGFTLIELIATLAVVAITLMLGIPSFKEAVQNNYMTSKINELVTDINLTRSEAVKRATTVTICNRSTDSTCSASDNWVNGWLVFVDRNGDGSRTDDEELLRVHEALSGLTLLDYSQSRITYNATGFLSGVLNGTFTFCDSRKNAKRKGRVLNSTGRLREAVSSDTLESCP
jgi:type IV fimbrial biogenesis protein FimT